jgi:hypothetical protein
MYLILIGILILALTPIVRFMLGCLLVFGIVIVALPVLLIVGIFELIAKLIEEDR